MLCVQGFNVSTANLGSTLLEVLLTMGLCCKYAYTNNGDRIVHFCSFFFFFFFLRERERERKSYYTIHELPY